MVLPFPQGEIRDMDERGIDLLKGIIAEPDDDNARLVYADYLEETEVTLECVKCKRPGDAKNWVTGHLPGFMSGDYWQPCTACGGATRVPYPAKDERAAFIRLQVEAGKHGPPHKRVGYEPSDHVTLEMVRGGGPDYWVFGWRHSDLVKGNRIDLRIFMGLGKFKAIYGLVVVEVKGESADRVDYVVKRDSLSGRWGGEASRGAADKLFMTHGRSWFMTNAYSLVAAGGVAGNYGSECCVCGSAMSGERLFVSRGFVSRVRCSVEQWFDMAYGGVYWYPTVSVPCYQFGYDVGELHAGCARCHGSGTVGIPCASNAQPVRKVELTGTPTVIIDHYDGLGGGMRYRVAGSRSEFNFADIQMAQATRFAVEHRIIPIERTTVGVGIMRTEFKGVGFELSPNTGEDDG